VPKVGKQTWLFSSAPRIRCTGTVAGKTEAEGPLGDLFDVKLDNDRGQAKTWEHAEQAMFKTAVQTLLEKSGQHTQDIDLLIGGDLNAQMTSFYFGLREIDIPSLGLYSACSTLTEGLAVSALAIDSQVARQVIVGTSSHNSTAERQFRYPTEYGAQKPPTSQRTVTGSGAALLAASGGKVAVTAATIGRVVDYGIQTPWEMGAAMAPAAEATIVQHLQDMGRTVTDYDCIATGDLGHIGHDILHELLQQRGMDPKHILTDCGMLIYRTDQPEVFSGGSGAACSSLVTFSHFLEKLESGEWHRILLCATGALLSAVSAGQSDTIPSISHGVVLERRSEES
jgi:stage V sporulation protein AD